MPSWSLHRDALALAYATGELTPRSLVARMAPAWEASGEGIWIHRFSVEELTAAAEALEARRRAGEALPLFGVPFAVKDNLDVQGLPTTAACPAFAYKARETAPVVARLLAAGALLVGKTNLDQFATGLVGVRSPYGVPANPFDARYITGGSSSGSAAAVSNGLVTFALGTDTAGSGRVPAAFTNTVGLKPSPGLLSTRGVVPACRSLDCVSVFALTVEDARVVAGLSGAFDPQDPYSRAAIDPFARQAIPATWRCGVPAGADLDFDGDDEARRAFARALERLQLMGAQLVPVELSPFFEAAALLYEGPWIAERLAGLEDFVTARSEEILPVTREILLQGRRFGATQVFAGLHRLAALRARVAPLWRELHAMVLPTTPTIYTQAQIAEEPLARNARLGRYTNFVNLLDLAALAVPNGFRSDGLPTGITFIGPWGSDGRLAALGEGFHQGPMGATQVSVSAQPPIPPSAPDTMRVAVVGAHLSGFPLNHQLTDVGARLVRACTTAPSYRLFALPGTTPPKPGLVRVNDGGVAIQVEVWEMPRAAFGNFFGNVLPPLAIGTIQLDDGERVPGFVCEDYATVGARDISDFGGWRTFRKSGI